MSSAGNNTSNSALKGAPNSATSPKENASGGSSANTSTNSSISLTPRFTNEEKAILYTLFRKHEEVIDIKHRKKQKGKTSVRDAWQAIVDDFNGSPSVTIVRNLKQIQKFWLNARLRKQYPFQQETEIKQFATPRKTSNSSITIPAKEYVPVPAPIKCEPEYILSASSTGQSATHNVEEYEEEIELQGTTINDPLNESPEESDDIQQIHEQNHQDIQQQILQQQQQQQQQQQSQQQQHSTVQAQQVNVDQISADKLTLNDLLHFKNARPRDEIILQIKHPDGGSITLPSPTRITIPNQHNSYNHIISEIKPQVQTPHIQVQHYQTQQIHQQSPQQVSQQQQIQQQFSAGNSAYCTYTTQHQPHTTTPTNIGQAITTANTASFIVSESFDEKVNYFKLKEAELRFKEVQLQLEQKRIDISRMQEELKHQKEMHRLQVDEMKIKIRILTEEERKLKLNKES